MNFTAIFLALIFGAATVLGQETTSPAPKGNAPAGQNAAPIFPTDRDIPVVQALPPGKNSGSTPSAERTTNGTRSAGAERDSGSNGGINTMTMWKLIQDGGWAMIPLGFLSVVTVMLVLVYMFTLRRGAILTPHYMNTADVLLKKRDYLGLLAISSRHSEAVARVVQRTLDFATKNPTASYEVVKDIAETEGSSQAASLQHRTVYLADIGMLAPMVGLLGTVFGIIKSFGVIGSGTSTQSRDVLLASGVSEALVATATGLVLGITAMFFYSLFRNRVQSLISDLEIASAHILGLIALNFNKKREQSRVAVDEEF
jgi:biopolymer transport protein ExbB